MLITMEFPGSPVVSTGHLNRVGIGSIPGLGTKIPQAAQPKKKRKKMMLITIDGDVTVKH